MRKVLHILTDSNDTFALELIAAQQRRADHEVKVVDWTTREPDCVALLEEIFRADSVEVW